MADQEAIAAANPPTAPTQRIPDKPVPDQFEGLRVRAVNFAKAAAAPMAAEVSGIKELGRQAVQQVTDPQKRLDLMVGMAQPGEMGPESSEVGAELGTAAKSLFEGLRVRLADTPAVQNVNASGESSASQEAISRLASEKSSSTQRVKIDTRSGRETPLIGVDAVDAKVQPHEVIVMRSPKGETLVDKGATARYKGAAKLGKSK